MPACQHLTSPGAIDPDVVPSSADECLDCVREGLRWVDLRMCLACGTVACCDSSPGRHARHHFTDSGHPLMRSFEQGENWRWCYVDNRVV